MKSIERVKQSQISILVIMFSIFGLGTMKSMSAQAGSLYVENYGEDSTICGNKLNPCRSLSKAIDNARNGDQLLVGPGLYGDLNGDNDFDDPGEESANSICGTLTRGGVICVDKPISIRSTHGANATILDAGDSNLANLIAVVLIASDKVVFGKQKSGFTITGGNHHGLVAQNTHQVTINSNIIANMENDFNASSYGILVSGNRGKVRILNNIVRSGVNGFRVIGSSLGKVTLTNNIASGNRGNGFNILGTAPHMLVNNISSNNGGSGYSVFGERYTMKRNTATANKANGIIIGNSGAHGSSSNHTFIKNVVVGNLGAGFYFNSSGSNNIVTKNNIYGNATSPNAVFRVNCGLLNTSEQTVIATKNFWGADSGPGGNPADDAGPNSNCDVPGNTIVDPFTFKKF